MHETDHPPPATDIWWSSLETCSNASDATPLVLTSSGDHRNTYGWQVDGTHHTGMLLSCSLFSAFVTYLETEQNIAIPPNHKWYCTLGNTVGFTSILSSTLLIASMTFERFYSIIRPHKAASFNTAKRAKIIIACIVSFSVVYNIKHMFITSHQNWQCQPYGAAIGSPMGQAYYWLSFIVNFALPFT